MREVLFMTYYFPPLGGVGPHRVLRLLRHLPLLGWKPSVLTVTESLPGELRDESLVQTIPPGVTVYRAPLWNIRKPVEWLQRMGAQRVSGLLERWIDCPPPDRHVGWLPSLLRKANEVLSSQRVDAIISVSAPYTAHLAGWILKRKHHRPWVVDLRDEWSANPLRRPLFSWQRKLDRFLESHVLAAADRIFMTTPSYCRAIAQGLPTADRGKVSLLTNGFDQRDFASLSPSPSSDRFHIVYSGSLYGPQDPSYFLRALMSAIEKGVIPKHRIQITFIGRASQAIERHEFAPHGGNGLVQRVAFVSHPASVRMLMEADALLLLVGKDRGDGNIPAKTFEYLAARKPILALVPRCGDAALLLHKMQAGWVVDPEDEAAIEKTLVHLYQRWATGTLTVTSDETKIGRYESQALAEQVAHVLDELVPAGGSS